MSKTQSTRPAAKTSIHCPRAAVDEMLRELSRLLDCSGDSVYSFLMQIAIAASLWEWPNPVLL
jgi:hypothetical protein